MKKFLLLLTASLLISAPSWSVVTTGTNQITYTGNGVTKSFSVPFKILAASDLVVTVDSVVKTNVTDYTVALQTNSATVTFVTAPTSAANGIIIRRARPFKQGQSFRVQGPLLLPIIENSFDDLEMQLQQLTGQSCTGGQHLTSGGGSIFCSSDTGSSGATQVTLQGVTPGVTDSGNIHVSGSIIGTLNASTVTATGGSGAVALADRFGRLPTIYDFGCAGNGSTDDTTCLNLAAVSGKQVFFPPGTFKATTTIQLSAGTVFVGSDPTQAVITFSGTPEPATTAAIRLNGASSGIKNLGINITAGLYGRGINLRADNQVVSGNILNTSTPDVPAGTAHYAIFSSSPAGFPSLIYNGLIEKNDITTTNVPQGDGMQVANSVNVRVLNNRIHDRVLSNELGACGGQLCGQQSWGIYVSTACFGALVQGNIIENNNHSGIHFNESGTVSLNVGRRMIGNYVHDNKYVCLGVDFSTGTVVQGNYVSRCDALLNIIASVDVTVSGNHFEDLISTTPPGSVNQGMVSTQSTSRQTIFVGNTFGKRGTAFAALDIETPDVLVLGNTIGTDRPMQAIITTSAATNLQVVGNLVQTTTDATAGQYVISLVGDNSVALDNTITMPAVGVGIRLAATNDRASNNRIIGGVGGVWMPSAATIGALVEGNIFSGQSGTILADSGTNTTKRNNKFSTGLSRGTSTLVAGTVTVATSEIQTGDSVILTHLTTGGAVGTLTLGAIVNGTSFVVNSSSGTDTSVVAWQIQH
jgi:hypothetical protein